MKRLFYTLSLVLLIAVSISGCGSDSVKQSDGKHLRLGMFTIGESIDPANAWDGWTLARIGACETLVTFNDKMESSPQLSDKWENVDPVTWRFHIRPGVKFQNGDAMTPELVKASLERVLKQNPRAKTSSKIKSLRLDGENLIIETTEPYEALAATLSDPLFAIVHTGAANNDIASNPILTGPYAITGFKKGEEIQLIRNEHYWDGKPGLDRLTVVCIRDNSTRAMALQSGELDMIQRLDGANRAQFDGNSDYVISQTIGVRVYLMSMNTAGVLADRNLREAVAAVIDYNEIANIAGNGAAPAGQIFPPSLPYGQVKNPSKYDPEKAIAALKAAGYTEKNADGLYVKDGKPLTLKLAVWGREPSVYEVILDNFRRAGINAELLQVSGADQARSMDYDFLEGNWATAGMNDPYLFLTQLFGSNGTSNFANYKSPVMDELLAKMAVAFDPAEKNRLVTEAAELLIADKPAVFYFFPTNTNVAKKSVKNIPAFPLDTYIITKDITIE